MRGLGMGGVSPTAGGRPASTSPPRAPSPPAGSSSGASARAVARVPSFRSSVVGRTEAELLVKALQAAADFYQCETDDVEISDTRCGLTESVDIGSADGSSMRVDPVYELTFAARRAS